MRSSCITRKLKLKVNYSLSILTGERDIQSLKVKCENHQQGCQWVGELRSAEEHPKTCEYVKLPCTYKCEGGNEKLFRKDLQQHLAEECPRRPYNCPHCKEPGKYNDIASQKHINICPKFIIACPNAPSCKISFERENKLHHLSTCKYEMIHCKYREIECKTMLMRKDLLEHENNHEIHIVGAMATVLSLKKQCSLLTTNLRQKMFKMPLFTQKMEKNIQFLSDPFYTYPNGYKMVFWVNANGFDKYKGTHVSVWVVLMRGDYDDQLEFPFKGTVTFELLNQLEDNNHHTASYTFEGTQDSSKRVIDREMSTSANGVHAFISHGNLGHNTTENCQCQYLKDDCLVFRVSVEVPSYKPWLQCP